MPRKTQMNSITSPEKTALINKSNMRLRDDFLSYLSSIQRSEGTIRQYAADLLIVYTFILEKLNNKDFQDLTKRDIVSMQNWLINEHGNSPARVRRIKSTISSLSNYIENVLDDEPEFEGFRSIVRKIESPVNQPVREKTVLTTEEVECLLDILTEKQHYDKACVVALAAYSGRRKSELVRFKVSDFGDDHIVCDGALYKSAPIKTKGRGVNGKQLNCFTLVKKFKPYLDNWMRYREENGIESEWLFPDKDDHTQQMSPDTLNSWAITFSRHLDKPVYLHSFRHFYTTELVRAGIPASVIKQIVGWESIDMVDTYTDIDADEQIGMYFSDGDISVPEKRGLSDV